jgi:Cu/Zn superoxide dismutase
MRLLAADIALTQQAQIGMMQGWLEVWGLPTAETGPAMSWMGHPTEGLMPGMATPEEIDLLQHARPEEADRLFLRLMIPHHSAAIPMAEAILARTDRSEVRQLAEAIENSQRAEIQTMEEMLRERIGDSATVELKPQNGSHTTGSATLTKSGGGVRVELSLSGLPKADTMYLAHIHPGTCAEGEEGEEQEEGHEHAGHGSAAAEEIEWPLSEVKADAQGHGSSTTTLEDVSMEKVYTGELNHINVHAAGSGNPPVLACADLY